MWSVSADRSMQGTSQNARMRYKTGKQQLGASFHLPGPTKRGTRERCWCISSCVVPSLHFALVWSIRIWGTGRASSTEDRVTRTAPPAIMSRGSRSRSTSRNGCCGQGIRETSCPRGSWRRSFTRGPARSFKTRYVWYSMLFFCFSYRRGTTPPPGFDAELIYLVTSRQDTLSMTVIWRYELSLLMLLVYCSLCCVVLSHHSCVIWLPQALLCSFSCWFVWPPLPLCWRRVVTNINININVNSNTDCISSV